MWSAFSSPPPTPCESQSRLPPRTAVRLICQAAHFKRPVWLCCLSSKGLLWPGLESKGRSSWHGGKSKHERREKFVFFFFSLFDCLDQTSVPIVSYIHRLCSLWHPVYRSITLTALLGVPKCSDCLLMLNKLTCESEKDKSMTDDVGQTHFQSGELCWPFRLLNYQEL